MMTALMIAWAALGRESLIGPMRAAVADGTVQGVALLVVRDGREVFAHAVGDASLDGPIQVASAAKPITAAVVLSLVEAGKLRLDDPLSAVLPEFAAVKRTDGQPARSPTLREVLTNRAGFPSDFAERSFPSPFISSLAEQVRTLADRGLATAPGGEFRYSTIGFNAAARAAEVAAGRPFDEYAEEILFRPLGMTTTKYLKLGLDGKREPNQARMLMVGGAMTSSVRDLATFYRMLLDGGTHRGRRILSPETVGLMRAPQCPVDEEVMGPMGDRYGLALFLDRRGPDGLPRSISHAGVLGAMPWADLDTKTVGVIAVKAPYVRTFPLVFSLQRHTRALTGAVGDEVAPHRDGGLRTR